MTCRDCSCNCGNNAEVEADKLRQENEALKAQVAALNNLAKDLLFREWAVVHIGTRYRKAEITVTDKQLEEWRMVLSTLPSNFLEIQKAKDAVIDKHDKALVLAISIIKCGEKISDGAASIFLDAMKSLETLRTLQQAQEIK